MRNSCINNNFWVSIRSISEIFLKGFLGHRHFYLSIANRYFNVNNIDTNILQIKKNKNMFHSTKVTFVNIYQFLMVLTLKLNILSNFS